MRCSTLSNSLFGETRMRDTSVRSLLHTASEDAETTVPYPLIFAQFPRSREKISQPNGGSSSHEKRRRSSAFSIAIT
jgi:hypothetical protein